MVPMAFLVAGLTIYQFRSHKVVLLPTIGILADVVWEKEHFEYGEYDEQFNKDDEP